MGENDQLRQLIGEYASLFFEDLPFWLHFGTDKEAMQQVLEQLAELKGQETPELLSTTESGNRDDVAGAIAPGRDPIREVFFEPPQEPEHTETPHSLEIAARIVEALSPDSAFAEVDCEDVDIAISRELHNLLLEELPIIVAEITRAQPVLRIADRNQYFQQITLLLRKAYESRHISDSIYELLRNQSQTYSFAVAMGCRSALGLNLHIGGSAKLSLKCIATPMGMYGHVLCGEIRAATARTAAEEVEVLLKQTIGATLATGLSSISIRDMVATPTGTVRLAPVDSEEDMHIDPALASISLRLSFHLPMDLNQLERHLISQQSDQALNRRLDCLCALLCGTSERAKELRNASCLLVDSYSARETGMSILLSFLCMEAVLLEKKDTESVVARLTEAVVYRSGRTAEERRGLRRVVKSLYNTRSQFVHTGVVERGSASQRGEAADLARRILSREIDDLLGIDTA